MRTLLLAVCVLAVAVPIVTPAIEAQNHHPAVYLWNGYQTTSTATNYWRGFYKYDRTVTPAKLTKLFNPPYYTMFGSACMDWDNRNFIFATNGSSSAGTQYDGSCKVYRYDTSNNMLSTIIKMWRQPTGTYPYGYQYCYDNILIDQDANYLFSFYQYRRVNTPTTVTQYTRGVLKYDTATKVLTTVLTSANLSNPSSHYFGYLTKDIDSGKVLIATSKAITSPARSYYPVVSIKPEDGYSTSGIGYWNDGSTYGWSNYTYNMEQNVRSGYIEGPYYYVTSSAGGRINQLKPGQASLTTITTIPTSSLPFTGSTQYLYTGKFDLQTAPRPSWKCTCYYYSLGSALVDFDASTWKVHSHTMVANTTTQPGITRFYPGQIEFWGGRHIQTARIAPHRWALLISVPHHAGKAYACALSLSGVRPGIPLRDGRTINMNWDDLMRISLQNLIPNIFNQGQFVLDGKGEARGALNINLLKPPKNGFGIPLWIGVAVLDPQAPSGVAYLPDTYVMRI